MIDIGLKEGEVPQGMLLGFAGLCETQLDLNAQYILFSWEFIAQSLPYKEGTQL